MQRLPKSQAVHRIEGSLDIYVSYMQGLSMYYSDNYSQELVSGSGGSRIGPVYFLAE